MLQCSATCGEGWQRRQVICQDERGNSDLCSEKQKPEDRQTCDAGACPTWVKGEWSQVSEIDLNMLILFKLCKR